MVLCSSCKNKTSTERCNNQALTGVIFCGKHVRVKNPRLWTAINNIDNKVNLISKLWKGYKIRKLIALAGPGVLNRSKCINTEEPVTFDSIKSIHPLDYFGFEEQGKVYGFDVRTLFDGLDRKCENPFTRQPLSMEVRKRIRSIYGYRLRNKLPIFYENNAIQTREFVLQSRWLQICQIIEENDFYKIHPNVFLTMNKTQLYIFISLICNDMNTLAAEHKNNQSIRNKYVVWLMNLKYKFDSVQTAEEYAFYVATVFLTILHYSVEPYHFCFIIMSALFRL